MTRKKRRLMLVGLGLALIGTATTLVLIAVQDSLVFFYSPSEVQAKHITPGRRFRLGGLVKEGSVKKEGSSVYFRITDLNVSLPVVFIGLLPDLFREGQGVVAEGRLNDGGIFRADNVLAKHDETYMPPDVADALKKSDRRKKEKNAYPE